MTENNNVQRLPKMRTISKGFEEYKQRDKNTCVTPTGFRRLIKTGKIPSVKVGNKTLVNMDHVRAFFAGELPEPEQVQQLDGIRRISER